MLSNCIGLSVTSPILSEVIGLELIIPSTSTSSVLNDSLLRLSPCCFSRAVRMLLADLIYCSHTPSILPAVGGLCFQTNHSSWFHQKVINLFFHFTECPFKLSACSNEIATIATLDNPNISSPTDEPLECLNKTISYHTVCCLYGNSETAQACGHGTMMFVFFDLLLPEMAQSNLQHSS